MMERNVYYHQIGIADTNGSVVMVQDPLPRGLEYVGKSTQFPEQTLVLLRVSFLLFAKGFLAVVSQIVFSDLSPIAK
jgi:hypothetical protein